MIIALTTTLVILTPVLAIALTGLFMIRRDYTMLREDYQEVNRRLNEEVKRRITLERQLDVDSKERSEGFIRELMEALKS